MARPGPARHHVAEAGIPMVPICQSIQASPRIRRGASSAKRTSWDAQLPHARARATRGLPREARRCVRAQLGHREARAPALRPTTAAAHDFQLGEGTDDRYDAFYPLASTQWDALCHIGHPVHGFYNGCSRGGEQGWLAVVTESTTSRGGIAGRFVLADIDRHRRDAGKPLRATESDAITAEEVEATLDAQGIRLEPGDILLLRFGWISWWSGASEADVRRSTSNCRSGRTSTGRECLWRIPSFPGLDRSEHTAEWMWDDRVAAVAPTHRHSRSCPST